MNKYKLIKLFEFRGVPVNIHWSLSVILIIVILGSLSDISLIVGAFSFWSIMLIHEFGHMWFATRQGLRTYSIDLYLIHGMCHHEEAHTEYENNVVAWGGVVAQAIVFIPCIIIEKSIGEFLPWFLYTPVLYLGYFSCVIAVFNLLPSKGLDGYDCWKTVPLCFKYSKSKKKAKKKNHLKAVK